MKVVRRCRIAHQSLGALTPSAFGNRRPANRDLIAAAYERDQHQHTPRNGAELLRGAILNQSQNFRSNITAIRECVKKPEYTLVKLGERLSF